MIIPKERNKICKKLKACPKPEATVKDIVDDSRIFKLIISAMDFGTKSSDNKRKQQIKQKMIQKLKKNLQILKENMDNLNQQEHQHHRRRCKINIKKNSKKNFK